MKSSNNPARSPSNQSRWAAMKTKAGRDVLGTTEFQEPSLTNKDVQKAGRKRIAQNIGIVAATLTVAYGTGNYIAHQVDRAAAVTSGQNHKDALKVQEGTDRIAAEHRAQEIIEAGQSITSGEQTQPPAAIEQVPLVQDNTGTH